MADSEVVSELRRLTAHHEESPGPELELVHCDEPVLINSASKYRSPSVLRCEPACWRGREELKRKKVEEVKEKLFFGGDCRE
jgi:hypothetical protein